ncbi:uncharacterized protein LOC106407623 [Brassica napus]|uniref:uncharacterized protein LOC106407623 n=1 Tax=Brassica napus TaxID=3708 RepID=UPI00207A8959|nr:uncharacterized protein LOC106407623 [Brassica napus]
MISLKFVCEYCSINRKFTFTVVDLLPRNSQNNRHISFSGLKMADSLYKAISAMSLVDDDPIVLPDDPKFRVFEANENSLLGRLLNPDCQVMSRMINYMATAWRVYGRVRGIALSRDRFQFIFQREEDLITVLKDRPWSYNHWTLLLERWCPSPPKDFLTSLEVWIRIRNIPMNYYTSETMYTLAKKIGHVEEIAYDPKVSQATDYIRAKVTLDVEKPAFEAKNLIIPGGDITVISYEYEKLHKRCFSCFRLTHEKTRCPYAKRKHTKPDPNNNKPSVRTPTTEKSAATNKDGKLLEGPPGFPALFLKLSQEDQRMAIQYVSHADETERRARIQRVQNSIVEAPGVQDVMLRISHDLNKDKGHVFNYNFQQNQKSVLARLGKAPAVSLPDPVIESGYESEKSVGQGSSSNLLVQGATVFSVGIAPPVSTGNQGSKKRNRNRPPAWVRRTRTNVNSTSLSENKVLESSQDSMGKRKASSSTVPKANKSSKTQEQTVASDLKPLPSQ